MLVTRSSGGATKSARLLLVQDRLADVEHTLRIFNTAPVNATLRVTGADDLLSSISDPREQPNMILLDGELQHGDAVHLLDQLKHDALLNSIPIAVLGAETPEDIETTFSHSADLFIAKPLDTERLLLTLNWLEGHTLIPPMYS